MNSLLNFYERLRECSSENIQKGYRRLNTNDEGTTGSGWKIPTCFKNGMMLSLVSKE